jgi:hypothetical protein
MIATSLGAMDGETVVGSSKEHSFLLYLWLSHTFKESWMRLPLIEVVYKELHSLTRGENSAHMHKLRFKHETSRTHLEYHCLPVGGMVMSVCMKAITAPCACGLPNIQGHQAAMATYELTVQIFACPALLSHRSEQMWSHYLVRPHLFYFACSPDSCSRPCAASFLASCGYFLGFIVQ